MKPKVLNRKSVVLGTVFSFYLWRIAMWALVYTLVGAGFSHLVPNPTKKRANREY